MPEEYEDYIKDVVNNTSAIPKWAKHYAGVMLLALLEEEIVAHRILSSGVHSPGPDGSGLLTITVDCFDLDNAYLATGKFTYDKSKVSDPIARHWELEEIVLEDKE